MDKHFARILMLSVLLPAGVSLGEAVERDYHSAPITQAVFSSPPAISSSGDTQRERAVESRRFLKLVAAEESAAARRFAR